MNQKKKKKLASRTIGVPVAEYRMIRAQANRDNVTITFAARQAIRAYCAQPRPTLEVRA